MKITLMCALGMSSEILVREIKKYCNEEDVVHAYSVQKYEEVIPGSDVVLIGPQARGYLRGIKKVADPLNIPVEIIDVVAYGRHDGKKIFEQVLRMINEKNN